MAEVSIIGFDGSEAAKRSVEYGIDRSKFTGAHLHIVYVLEWSPFSFQTPEELAERHMRREQELDRARSVVQPVLDRIKAEGIEVTSQVTHGNARDLLCDAAVERKASQIIIGRTGDSKWAQRLLGSLANGLAQIAPVPVTIVP